MPLLSKLKSSQVVDRKNIDVMQRLLRHTPFTGLQRVQKLPDNTHLQLAMSRLSNGSVPSFGFEITHHSNGVKLATGRPCDNSGVMENIAEFDIHKALGHENDSK